MSNEDLQKLLLSAASAVFAGVATLLLRPKSSNVAEAVKADVEHRIRRSKKEDASDGELNLLALRTAAGNATLLNRLTDERFNEFTQIDAHFARIDGKIADMEGQLTRILELLTPKV